MTLIALAALAYLLGSISFAVIVARAFGLPDPRSYGSGNPGASNVLRSGSKAAAAFTLLGDAGKGWLAVWLAGRFAETGTADATVAVAALAVTLGHLYPVYFRFRGGKGVSTALGVLIAIEPWLASGALAVWLAVALRFRIASLAALVSAGVAPLLSFLLHGMGRIALESALAITVIAALLVWRHRANIRNLLAGTESRFGGGAGAPRP
ncbi:MAG TPA: glycerol-3-phosphate 1-O-acyltransferase PlsY [Burkholderiales bacterium]|nr:glycerol-3-phosphate 1-O-acyltransferase PlsY [Burkholderiales bacterium]